MLNFKIKLFLSVYLAIACLCLLFYWGTLHNPFILDDGGLIIKNSSILDWHYWDKAFTSDMHFGNMGGGGSNFYRPVQTLSFMWDYHFWRLNPLGYHITNILLQSIVAFLVFLLVYMLSDKMPLAFVSSLLFAINPLHTEAVTYISGRADMLMAVFLLLSLLLFIKSENSVKYRRALYLLSSLLLFILGLLSKELAFIFPLVILLFVFIYKRSNFKDPWYTALVIFPFFAIDLIYAITRYTLLQFSTLWVAELSRYPLVLRIYMVPKVFFTYIRLLFFPVGLHMSWGLAAPGGIIEVVLSWFLLTVFIGVIWHILCKYNKKEGYFLFWLFFIFLAPQLGVYPINAFLAEHFIYISSISFFVAISYLLFKYLRKSLLFFCVLALLLFYGTLTLARNYEWSNPFIFYQGIVKFSPDSFLAHNNLGVQYAYINKDDSAIAEFKKAVRINPTRIDARSNLAKVYQKTGRFKDAESEYAVLEKITPYDKAGELQNEIAVLYETEGHFDKALDRYRLALRFNPSIFFLHFNIARLTADSDKAAGEIIKSLQPVDSNQPPDKALLGAVKKYIKESGYSGCAVSFYNNLGINLAQAGFDKEAIRSFKRVLELSPEYADAHFNLGLTYWNCGRKQKAISEFRVVLKIQPQHYKARGFLYNLAR